MKVTVIANCQANPIASLLDLACSKLDIIRCPPVHTISGEQVHLIHDRVKQSDIVVHQPIGESFGPISINHLKAEYPQKTFVSFPSIYFGGIFPHISYLRKPTGILQGPLYDYHDVRIVAAYLNDIPVLSCVSMLEEDTRDYSKNFWACLHNSKERERALDVQIMDFALDQLQDNPTFFTFNHPNNAVLYEAAKGIIKILGLNLNTGFSPPKRVFLDSIQIAIPQSIPKIFGAQWKRNSHIKDLTVLSLEATVLEFFKAYDREHNMQELVQSNKKRFSGIQLEILASQ